MGTNKKIGVLALIPDEWGPYWQTRHQVLTRLSAHFPVVWINEAHEWRAANHLRKNPPKPWDYPGMPSDFKIYNPEWWLPKFYRPNFAKQLTSTWRLEHARELLKKSGCNRVVLYLWRPEFSYALDQISHDLSCYHIDDEYSFSSVEQRLDPSEVKLIKSVDRVFIHSPELMNKKGSLNPHTAFIPNGVDYESYASIQPEPSDLKAIARPRIGYTGFLKDVLEWQILIQLAERHPEWSYVFVGPSRPQQNLDSVFKVLKSMPNVFFLGGKPTLELSSYPQHFDACIMPYRLDGYTKFISPLKLHEYLASGRPVIGKELPSLLPFRGVVPLVNTFQEWEREIATALSPEANTPEKILERQAIAANHDWTQVVSKISATMRDGVN